MVDSRQTQALRPPCTGGSRRQVDTIDEARVLAALRDGLAGASTPAAAAEEVVGGLLQLGYELPSVYVERGGRLRCLAQRGYWQVFDGVPPHSGVLGRSFASGRTLVIRSVADVADYIRAVP